jgi:Xaa-Pro aminopeptidase
MEVSVAELSKADVEASRRVQAVAKDVLARLPNQITPEDSERSLVEKAIALLRERGVNQTWYHDCPALVLLGSRSCLSVSGRTYVPSEERVGQHNLITVDLSPLKDGACGDCARSLFVEDGAVTAMPHDPALAAGKRFLAALHAEMMQFVQPATTLDELFVCAERRIRDAGFENLDFLGNVGHAMARRREDRIFIERGNRRTLGEIGLFTFEPHVRQIGGKWGFKHEAIYFFNESGKIEEL